MRGGFGDHAATVLVAALASAFGVGLLGATEVMALATEEGPFASSGVGRLVLTVIALVFTAIAIYVAAIVTTNTVATIVVGRVRQFALVRLLGGTAAQLRRALAAQGLAAGAIGSLVGSAVALLLIAALLPLGLQTGVLPARDYPFLTWTMLVPVVAVILSVWLASWAGSRRVLAVSPVQALGAAVPAAPAALAKRRGRAATAVVLGAVGLLLLAAGALLGQRTPLGLLVALPGGVLAFSGFMLGGVRVVPGIVAVAGRLFGRGPAAQLGRRNAVREPERVTRAAMGLIIGVALVTMFIVAGMTTRRMMIEWALEAGEFESAAEAAELIDPAIGPMMAIIAFLTGYSAVIAAVGLVNTLTVSVLQRTREFGLLRALGLSRVQLRRVIAVEAAQLAFASVVVGVLIGVGFGWVGAQSLLGAQQTTGVVPPVLPWWLVVAVLGVGGVLAVAGSLIPARRAGRIPPVEALATG